MLKRFFADDELSERVDMLKYKTENPEVRRIVEKYGPGFDVIYFDGKDDGTYETELKFVSNMLAEGVDEEIISRCAGLSIDKIKQLKRKL